MRRTVLALSIASALAASACSTLSHEEEDTAAGAVMGLLVGSLFGDGAGRAAAMAVGGVVGGLAGNAVGRDLDDAEHRRFQRAALTVQPAGADDGERCRDGALGDPQEEGGKRPEILDSCMTDDRREEH